MTEASDKVDIFKFLDKVDSGDASYYSELSEQQKKSLSLVVAARWLSCTKNTKQLINVNNLVNSVVFKFASKHPELLYNLMLISSSGTTKRYKWVSKKKSTSKKPVTVETLSAYYGISRSKAQGYLPQFTLEEVIDCADSLGYDDQLIKKIKNEFK